jgi:LPXTG-site transpeptidase (sortase) family protein
MQIETSTRIIVYIFLTIITILFINFYPIIFRSKENISTLKISDINFASATPTKIIIPKLGIETKVLPVGKTKEGALDVPNSLKNVGWYIGGVRPGERGNAVIDGHEVDELGFGAVFKNLYLLEPGDSIFVENENGDRLEFQVNQSLVYDFKNAPLEKIFGNASTSNLNLITCNGEFLRELKTKDKRLVVYTNLKNQKE